MRLSLSVNLFILLMLHIQQNCAHQKYAPPKSSLVKRDTTKSKSGHCKCSCEMEFPFDACTALGTCSASDRESSVSQTTSTSVGLQAPEHDPNSTVLKVLEHRNFKRLPRHPNCGESAAKIDVGPRLMGGENAEVGEFPWIARLGYVDRQKRDERVFRCDGTILSEFFLITSARCALGNETGGKALEVARLGEYNLDTDPDCEEDNNCADAYVDYIVSKLSIHSDYQESTRLNNIALVRVDKKMEFTKYIQPICLLIGKNGELMKKFYSGQNARLAAWGKGKDFDAALSQSILQRLTVEVKDPNTCQDCQSPAQKLGKGQICAGGIALQGPCNDDGGAPLMVQELSPPRWHLLGLDSCGKCGSTIPHVYTRVTDYLLWILDRM